MLLSKSVCFKFQVIKISDRLVRNKRVIGTREDAIVKMLSPKLKINWTCFVTIYFSMDFM